ncbi:MAG TPA: CAP domain-containing protein [Candidatus Absconditabacterales bacterium]|nr:CAP domain-containing protein [Candidatus Absconditabacterales bacterium]
MKKIKLSLLGIGLLGIGLLGIGTTDAGYDANTKIKNRIDGVMSVVERDRGQYSTITQINKYQKIIDSFGKIKLTGEGKDMIGYLLYLFEEKVEELEEEIVTQDELIKNVNWDRVEKAWLEWHNAERRGLGLDEYSISESLNFSSLEWAQKLAKQNYSTHERKTSDNGYNYYSILNWFNGLGIDFDYNGTAFSENIAYQYYNCKKSDCTQNMINALKKGFDFWMSEKWETEYSKRAHYRAIIHPYFDEIGVGVALVGKRYWVVSHYGINVE